MSQAHFDSQHGVMYCCWSHARSMEHIQTRSTPTFLSAFLLCFSTNTTVMIFDLLAHLAISFTSGKENDLRRCLYQQGWGIGGNFTMVRILKVLGISINDPWSRIKSVRIICCIMLFLTSTSNSQNTFWQQMSLKKVARYSLPPTAFAFLPPKMAAWSMHLHKVGSPE